MLYIAAYTYTIFWYKAHLDNIPSRGKRQVHCHSQEGGARSALSLPPEVAFLMRLVFILFPSFSYTKGDIASILRVIWSCFSQCISCSVYREREYNLSHCYNRAVYSENQVVVARVQYTRSFGI